MDSFANAGPPGFVGDSSLIIFLKYPEPGKVKTRLAATLGAEKAAQVYRRLSEQTLARLCSHTSFAHQQCAIFFDPPGRDAEVRRWLTPLAGSAVFHAQVEGDLGFRMAQAFRHTFAAPGVTRAVIIGTDCPQLRMEIVQKAFEVLNDYPAVIGPAADGGYYLLGLREEMPCLFEGISWSTDRVLIQTLDALNNCGIGYALLPTLQDVDTETDLHHTWPQWQNECL